MPRSHHGGKSPIWTDKSSKRCGKPGNASQSEIFESPTAILDDAPEFWDAHGVGKADILGRHIRELKGGKLTRTFRTELDAEERAELLGLFAGRTVKKTVEIIRKLPLTL